MFEIKDGVDLIAAKDLLEDIDLAIRHQESIRSQDSLIWMAMSDHKRAVNDRYLRILTNKQTRIENLLTEHTCQGCDDFVEYGSLHDNHECMSACRKRYKEDADPRV